MISRRRPHVFRSPAVDLIARVNATALPLLPSLLARWLPGGRREGTEWVALNPTRADRNLGSFRIVCSGPKAGLWCDFATGDRGRDAVSLVAYLRRTSQSGAACALAQELGVWR